MNKNNTAETTLNNIKSMCAKRDRREQSILKSNRMEMDKREAAEKERIQSTNSILNIISKRQRQERISILRNVTNPYRICMMKMSAGE